jgi:hypothetical protein
MMKAIILIFTIFLTGSTLVVGNALALEEIFQPTPEERLSSLKRSLMDYAMDHSAHVTTSAWLDGNGAIEENVHLLSALSLENIRVNEYRNDFGYMETVIIDAPRSDITLWETCPVTSILKKRVKVEIVEESPRSNVMANLSREAREILEISIQESGFLGEVAVSQVVLPSARSLYTSRMSNRPTPRSGLMARLSISVKNGVGLSTDGVLGLRLSRSGYYLSIGLEIRDHGEQVYQRDEVIRIPKPRTKNTMATLIDDQDAFKETRAVSSSLAEDLAEVLKCEAASNLFVSRLGSQVRLEGGADLGVTVGQHFLVVPDSRHFAAFGLEDALNSTILVKVDRVYPRYSTISLLSGNLAGMKTDEGFIAVPLASMNVL